MKIHKIQTGFSDLPDLITMNIFAVGCPWYCKGCHVPKLQDPDFPDQRDLTVADFIPLNDGFYDAVAWMGGDPIFQQDEYIKAAEWVQNKHPDKLSVCFTGYLYENISDFTKQFTDVIIDGTWQGIPYQEQGSNQRIWYKDTQITYQELEELCRKCQ